MSQTQPIPFQAGQASGLSELSGAQPVLRNFIPDAAGTLRVRPGIEAWSDFPEVIPNASSVIGMFIWRQYLLYVCADRTIWAWIASGLVVPLSDATAATKLDGSGKPIWTYDSTRVVVTGGGAPQQWQGVGLSSRLAPGAVLPSGSPLALTHIAYSAQRFIGNANDNSGYLVWTPPGPGNHTSWPIVGPYFAEAEASPDPTLATWANSNETFAFGANTTQVYVPDPSIAFSVAATINSGLGAQYSVIPLKEGAFAWLDDNRRLVVSAGREVQVISSPQMARDISSFDTVSDCWGANIIMGEFDLMAWFFPTEKRGIYYDRVTKKFGELDSNDANGNSIGFIATSYVYWNDRNMHFVGLSDGRIAVLSEGARRDVGTQIQAVARTGFIDRGTFSRKVSEYVYIQIKRGATQPGDAAPLIEYRYRDDFGAFQSAIRRTLGEAGEYAPVIDAWSLGVYRQREHEIRFSDAGDFVLAGATETFSLGDS